MGRERAPLPTRIPDTPELPIAFIGALDAGLAALHLELDSRARAVIDGHVRLLSAWTSSINLTAIREPAAMARQHVIDSLTALPVVGQQPVRRLVDLGSGGGFPGLPLAAARPDIEVTLLEPVAKKARFLATAAEAAGIADRVSVQVLRAETVAADPARRRTWDVVTARAVGPLAELVELAFPLLVPGGRLIAWKRGDLDEELLAAERAIRALGGGDLRVEDVAVPDLAGHRLVVATSRSRVAEHYPRDPSARRRRPW